MSTTIYRMPEFIKIMNEHMDIYDDDTRHILMNVNENDQAQVITSLTSKLYDNIVDKVDDVDFGSIPETKGDITKMDNYDKLIETVQLMEEILEEFKQDTASIKEISNAIENIEARKDMFEKAYKFNIEMPMLVYNTICLAIVSAVSFMIASCIEFIKAPNDDTFTIVVDRVAVVKTKDHLLYDNLRKFNASCKRGELDKALNHIIDNKFNNLTGTAASLTIIGSVAVAVVIFNIIPILRELIFFFFYNRVKMSDYFETQADLLQMNAYNLEQSQKGSKEERDRISKRQIKISDSFRKLSNFVSIKCKDADVKATKEIVSDNKKYKADEIMDSMPDSAASSLF